MAGRPTEHFREKFAKFMEQARLEHESVEVMATPRRLVVLAKAVAGRQADVSERLRGPPAKVSYLSRNTPGITACLKPVVVNFPPACSVCTCMLVLSLRAGL